MYWIVCLAKDEEALSIPLNHMGRFSFSFGSNNWF